MNIYLRDTQVQSSFLTNATKPTYYPNSTSLLSSGCFLTWKPDTSQGCGLSKVAWRGLGWRISGSPVLSGSDTVTAAVSLLENKKHHGSHVQAEASTRPFALGNMKTLPWTFSELHVSCLWRSAAGHTVCFVEPASESKRAPCLQFYFKGSLHTFRPVFETSRMFASEMPLTDRQMSFYQLPGSQTSSNRL